MTSPAKNSALSAAHPCRWQPRPQRKQQPAPVLVATASSKQALHFVCTADQHSAHKPWLQRPNPNHSHSLGSVLPVIAKSPLTRHSAPIAGSPCKLRQLNPFRQPARQPTATTAAGKTPLECASAEGAGVPLAQEAQHQRRKRTRGQARMDNHRKPTHPNTTSRNTALSTSSRVLNIRSRFPSNTDRWGTSNSRWWASSRWSCTALFAWRCLR